MVGVVYGNLIRTLIVPHHLQSTNLVDNWAMKTSLVNAFMAVRLKANLRIPSPRVGLTPLTIPMNHYAALETKKMESQSWFIIHGNVQA